jgi:hypothetical protein
LYRTQCTASPIDTSVFDSITESENRPANDSEEARAPNDDVVNNVQIEDRYVIGEDSCEDDIVMQDSNPAPLPMQSPVSTAKGGQANSSSVSIHL